MSNISVVLYKNTAPKNKVDKSKNLKNAHTFNNVVFTEGTALDVRRPSVLVKLTSDASDMASYNYARLAVFNRYYYIDSITAEGGLVRINLISDSLMSFKKEIYESKQYVIRNQNERSPYLVDSKIPIRSDKRYHQTIFGNPVSQRNCPYVILETTGRGGTPA